MDEPEYDLTDRQMAQYASLEIIVENFGMFTQDAMADGAHYMPAENNPFAEEGLACVNCVFYQGGNACEIVEGAIEEQALCKLWIIPEELLDAGIHKASYTPPEAVRSAARQALEWIADGKQGDGFTAVGRYRAETLAAGKPVNLDTIMRMKSYFARHEVDKQGKGWERGSDGYPSAGRVAWAAWGGDAGRSWANSIAGDVEKQRSFGGNRSLAAQYAARVRWGSPRNIDPDAKDELGQTNWGEISPTGPALDGEVAVALLENNLFAKVNAEEIPKVTAALLAGEGKENIRNLEIVGTPFFDDHGMMMERDAMPQVPSTKKTQFVTDMESQGFTVTREQISPRALRPIQSEINGKTSAEIRITEMQKGKNAFVATEDRTRIIVSSDGYVMDGHHRWAAAALHELHGNNVQLSVIRINSPRDALMQVMQTWTDKAGVPRLGFGVGRTPVGKALAFRKACEIGLQAQKEFLHGAD